MFILELLDAIIIKTLEFLERLTGIPSGAIVTFIIFVLFVLSVAAIVFLARKKFNINLKATLIIFFAFICFVTGLLVLIMADGYRIKRGAELFVRDAISALSKGKLPPVSSNMTEEKKREMETFLNNLPKENYRMEYMDCFGDVWEFYIHFENGKTFFCAVDSGRDFMKLFAKAEYKLFTFKVEFRTFSKCKDRQNGL